jgi:hypothetical protein
LSPAIYLYEIGLPQRTGDYSSFAGGIERQIVVAADTSLRNANHLSIFLHFHYIWISVTKLWKFMFRLYMCQSRTGHPNIMDSKSSW